MSHALVIGGTGMLRDVSLYVAGGYRYVSVLARTKKDLDALERNNPDVLRGVCADYTNRQELDDALQTAVSERGTFDIIIAWIHDPVLPVALRFADFASKNARYIHVRGSAAADPSYADASVSEAFQGINVIYEEVILGFVIDGHHSWWLDNAEISQGIIGALQNSKDRTIVGVVEPWSARP